MMPSVSRWAKSRIGHGKKEDRLDEVSTESQSHHLHSWIAHPPPSIRVEKHSTLNAIIGMIVVPEDIRSGDRSTHYDELSILVASRIERLHFS